MVLDFLFILTFLNPTQCHMSRVVHSLFYPNVITIFALYARLIGESPFFRPPSLQTQKQKKKSWKRNLRHDDET